MIKEYLSKSSIIIFFIIFLLLIVEGEEWPGIQYQENLGIFPRGSVFKVKLFSVNDYSYVYYDGNNLASDSCVTSTKSSYLPSEPFNKCAATCINSENVKCSPTSRSFTITPTPGNHTIKIIVLDYLGSGCSINSIIQVKKPWEKSFSTVGSFIGSSADNTLKACFGKKDRYPSNANMEGLDSKNFSFCIKSKRCSDYPGRCGTGFSNGCSNSLNCSCPPGYYCNVSTGKGYCLPNEEEENTGNIENLWANLNFEEINETDLGDSVLMVFSGEIEQDKNLTFQIQSFNSSTNSWNLFSRFRKNWGNTSKIEQNSGYEIFIINDTNKKRFNVSIEGTNVWNLSNNLTVLTSRGELSNSKPLAIITHPEINNEKGFYEACVNQTIEFKQESEDEDDLLKIFWDFGDNTNRTFYNYSKFLNKDSANVNKNYSREGFYNVVLRAKEMTREQEDYADLKVYSYKEGISIFPIISSPENERAYDRLVKFNASESYVINCSRNIPNGNFSICGGYMNCSYILEPFARAPKTGKVYFRWEISEDEGQTWEYFPSEQGYEWNETNYNLLHGVVYDRLFGTVKLRQVRFSMKFEG